MIAHWDCFAPTPACGLNPLFCSNWQSDIARVTCDDCREVHDAAVVISEARGPTGELRTAWDRHRAGVLVANAARGLL